MGLSWSEVDKPLILLQGIPSETLKAVCALADLNGDGEVDYAEFARLIVSEVTLPPCRCTRTVTTAQPRPEDPSPVRLYITIPPPRL